MAGTKQVRGEVLKMAPARTRACVHRNAVHNRGVMARGRKKKSLDQGTKISASRLFSAPDFLSDSECPVSPAGHQASYLYDEGTEGGDQGPPRSTVCRPCRCLSDLAHGVESRNHISKSSSRAFPNARVPELSGCLFTGRQRHLKFQAFQGSLIHFTV